MPGNEWLQRDLLTRHSLDLRQFIDFRESTLPNGNHIFHAHNSSGLTFTVLPDRGLDLWSAHYNGLPLTWLSPGSPRPPAWGQSWLREFNGGLLVTCGLTHVGPPEKEPITEGGRDLHGLYSKLPAYNVTAGGAWDAGDRYTATLRGTVSESAFSGEQVQLERAIALPLGEPAITVSDTITNAGIFRVPLMVLYHFNFGYPLVRDGAQFDAASVVRPRDEEAWKGAELWPHYTAADPGYFEKVYFHHCNMAADDTARAALFQQMFGIAVEWDARALPYLTQWKNTRQGMYVCGVEPGNCIPEGQVAARDAGRLVWLEPGETVTYTATIRVLDGADAVAAVRAQIAADRASGTPAPSAHLDDYPAV